MNKKVGIGICVGVVILLLIAMIFVFAGDTENNHVEIAATTATEAVKETVEPTSQDAAGETVEGVEEWENETTEGTEESVDVTTVPTTEATEPEETTAPTTEATEPEDTKPAASAYLWYASLSAEEQQKYYESFASPEAFFAWFNAAKAEYEASKDYMDSDNPNADMGEILGGNG